MRWTVISLLALFLGCATLGGVAERKPKPERGIKEDFDPLSLEDDELISELHEEKVTPSPKGQTQPPQPLKPPEPSPREGVPGYRVQICATSDEEKARAIKRKAMLRFDERVYMVYDTPYYKVRVGDCRTRMEAEELKKKAIQKGFHDAWIVRTIVYKQRD